MRVLARGIDVCPGDLVMRIDVIRLGYGGSSNRDIKAETFLQSSAVKCAKKICLRKGVHSKCTC